MYFIYYNALPCVKNKIQVLFLTRKSRYFIDIYIIKNYDIYDDENKDI
jgi:hypothetical protein